MANQVQLSQSVYKALFDFRNIGLQKAFDNDWKNKFITSEGVRQEASADGKLAYKLLLGTGDPDETAQVAQNITLQNEK